ncbi:type I-E CRISPR-associated protein Cas5/CasD [Streptomyces sp. NBC_00006]|uniref:type I-E CRISPR-associated protein Cas5/CasD n=1 Tax=Streptomyces sp. NBC_00006 TaxID=2975619 RepID=UPI002256EFCB|nr:type I-E CRISPR-associated protein Cas5/CasD [Streptomyces sp. NBC_00006]MCX5535177.1 type I-E CRISPR-associated protein Cas5/CasD [Streptomyces sp. NBC_00006]
MTGLLMHLSAPWQSWGAPSDFKVRPTHRHPTRSALTGLIAAALGRPREHPNEDLAALSYTIRIDRPGHREMDYQTIGGGYPREHTPPTADGKRRKEGTETMETERWYLADAAFTVAVTGPGPVTDRAAHALAAPVYAPYLGRRSCPPDTPILLRAHLDDAVAELFQAPLHTAPPRGADTIDVTFLHDTPPTPDPPSTTTVRDVPGPGPGRTFTERDLWETHHPLPAGLCAGRGTSWINALTTYLHPTPALDAS